MADRVALKISKSNLNADLKDLQLMDDVSKDEKERITSELIADYKVEEQVFFDSLSPNWLNIILASLLPIIAGWCLISPLIRLIRWINAGFQKNDKH